MEPVFLLSLPRSGSTILQSVLASHPEVTTTSEPWLLIPQIYALRKNGIAAEYEQLRLSQALEDFCTQLPGDQMDYFDEIRKMTLSLYSKVGNDVTYFIDKTPRYHLILDELVKIFPTAKIILLWRNPLAVAASMINTWNQGKWNLHWFNIDIYTGLANLIRLCAKEKERILTLRFEDFVSHPDAECKRIFDYLNLPIDYNFTDTYSNELLQGRMGDKTGITKYRTIDTGSSDKWKQTMANPLRRIWSRRYLNWIGESRLAVMGYQIEELLQDLKEEPYTANALFSDAARMVYGVCHVAQQNKRFSRKTEA